MVEEVKHLIHSVLVGLSTMAIGGFLVNTPYAVIFSLLVAFAWIAWKLVESVLSERKRNE